eukprot:GHVS01092111.1.p1 GENE.GHVS01092111.1~~GHVS01092111.1.p1  ORF type:complete len:229 (+),score=35.50 GHVS01092111.1:63-749(+)
MTKPSIRELPFDQLKKLKQELDQTHEESTGETVVGTTETHKRKRVKKAIWFPPVATKSGPCELSSRRPQFPPNSRMSLGVKKPQARDPRFSEFSGRLNLDLAAKSYEFLNDMRVEEKARLRELAGVSTKGRRKRGDDRVVKGMTAEEIGEAQKLYQSMESQDIHRERLKQGAHLKRTHRKTELEKAQKTGKKLYFIGRSAVRQHVTEVAEKSKVAKKLPGGSKRREEQ